MLESARQQGFLGASLEAKVLLHVGDPAIAEQLAALQQVCAHTRMTDTARSLLLASGSHSSLLLPCALSCAPRMLLRLISAKFY